MSNRNDITDKINKCKQWLIYINESKTPGEFAFVPLITNEDSEYPQVAETITGFIVRGTELKIEGATVAGFMVDDPVVEADVDAWFVANESYLEAFGLK